MSWEEYINFASSKLVEKAIYFVKMQNVKIVLFILMILIIELNMKKK